MFLKRTLLILFPVILSASVMAEEPDLNDFQQGILDRHNHYRLIAGLQIYRWNPDLVKLAESWAQRLQKKGCKLSHSSGSTRSNVGPFSYVGENLYGEWSSGALTVDRMTGEKAVDSWYSEIASFQYSPKGVICPLRGKKGVIGHFTQVMWAESNALGCAYALCSSGKSVVVVCNYGPGGNFNMRTTAPFSPVAAKRLDEHPDNRPYGGMPSCK